MIFRIATSNLNTIDITNEGRELLEGMCNLGEGIFERGVEQGIKLGRVEELINTIKKMLTKGVSESMIINLIDATPDQIERAKLELETN